MRNDKGKSCRFQEKHILKRSNRYPAGIFFTPVEYWRSLLQMNSSITERKWNRLPVFAFFDLQLVSTDPRSYKSTVKG